MCGDGGGGGVQGMASTGVMRVAGRNSVPGAVEFVAEVGVCSDLGCRHVECPLPFCSTPPSPAPVGPHLILIEVGVQQLAVVGVDDGGAVATSKHVLHPLVGEGDQLQRLGAQADGLLV